MQKLFTLASALFANIDKTHDRITAAYNLWGTIYGFILSLRGDAAAVPVPEAVKAPAAAPVAAPAAPAPAPVVEDDFALSQPSA